MTADQYQELYNQGMTDREIADALGVVIHRVTSWRSYRHIPANRKHKPYASQYSMEKIRGVAMETALTAAQCENMQHFINMLHWAADRVQGRLDISCFINAYRQEFGRGETG